MVKVSIASRSRSRSLRAERGKWIKVQSGRHVALQYRLIRSQGYCFRPQGKQILRGVKGKLKILFRDAKEPSAKQASVGILQRS